MSDISVLPTHYIDSLHKFIRKDYPFIKNIVFDPQAGYESSIGHLRVTQASLKSKNEDKNTFPFLSWNRSILRRAGNGRPIATTVKSASGDWVDIEASVSSFDYKFVFMATDMLDVERFELGYSAKTGINSITDCGISVPGLGEFKASVVWAQELEDIVFSLEGNYHKALSGSATLSGVFFTANATSPDKLKTMIQDITFSIYSCKGNGTPEVRTIIPE